MNATTLEETAIFELKPSYRARLGLLVWGVLLDVALWSVLPDGVTWIGAGIIVASGLYLLRREKVHVEAEHP